MTMQEKQEVIAMTTENHTPKIVARIDRFVSIYLCLNGEYEWCSDDCRLVTAHELTETETVCANKNDLGHVEITRGKNNINIADYYVDEIQVLYAGEWHNITALNQKVY